MRLTRRWLFVIVPVAALSLLLVGGWFWLKAKSSDPYANFLNEVYSGIQQNYWQKIPEADLSKLFVLAEQKLTGQKEVPSVQTKDEVLKEIRVSLAKLSPDKKKDFVLQLTDLVLANLQPFGRSRLYGQAEETKLRETVANVNPQTGKIEPTVFAKTLTPDIVLLRMTKLSPQTFDEFQKVTAEVDKTSQASSLILDLRGNVGGAIDLLQYFLGPFIGPNQQAYEFFHQEDYQPFKTQVGWLSSLVRYKKVVILVDGQTQSSAELMAAVLKKYNVGIVVGTTTKGWGTVENTFPLKQQIDPKEKYSLFLVHSLTLRDDNQPIEGKGVDPLINVANKDWPQELFAYLHYQELVDAVKDVINNK